MCDSNVKDVCTGDDSLGDTDKDGICDDPSIDICEGFSNTDADKDKVCDDIDICTGFPNVDDDKDKVCNIDDLCDGNDASGDIDKDGLCDSNVNDICTGDDSLGDDDNDGICDDPALDICVGFPNDDADKDGICDTNPYDLCAGNDSLGDADNDGVCDDPALDICEGFPNIDDDNDGLCNDLDLCYGVNSTGDIDKDGICDGSPLWTADSQGIIDLCFGNNASLDTDNDKICNNLDACVGDDASGNDDNDGFCNNTDPCYGLSNVDSENPKDSVCDDVDACTGDDAFPDTDGDGICENIDICYGDDALRDADNNGICGDQTPCVPPYDYVIVEHTYVDRKGITLTDRFELTTTHTATAATEPGAGSDWGPYWALLGANDMRAANFSWSLGTTYTTSADTCPAVTQAPSKTPIVAELASVVSRALPAVSAGVATFLGMMSVFETEAQAAQPIGVQGLTQREVIHDAIKTVVGGARPSVNFGALVYGSQNKGANVAYDMADLSGADTTAFDAFMAAIPGPTRSDGPDILSSQTARPQAEALYDAGRYFGATYPAIAIGSQIPAAIKNKCDYNHIIFITNGLSNEAGDSKLKDNIGDADGDGFGKG